MQTDPPILETGTVQYSANLATWQRIKAMIPAWKGMQDGDWQGFVVEPDEVGSNLEPFLKGMVEHWDACVGDGWPLWFVLEDDLTEAITTLQTMLAEMQKIAPPQMKCGVTSRLDTNQDTLHEKYLDAARKRAIYELYLDEIEAGPIDGGCWAFAHAAQKVYGGHLETIVGTAFRASATMGHHVVLRKGKRYFDADGWSTREELLERWRSEERIEDPTLRPFQESDVPGSPRIPDLVTKTVELLTGDVPSSEADPIDDPAWDPVWTAFALRHEVRSGELTAEDSVIDLAAFDAFIEPASIDMVTAYALTDGVPHVAGWTGGDYQFWVWNLWDIDKVVVIEDQPYCGCYCLPPLREWPNFWKGNSDAQPTRSDV